MSSSWIDPLIYLLSPSLSLAIFSILRSALSDLRIATPALFCSPFAWNIFFHPFTFSLYVSLGLKLVSHRQHIFESCFYIHSASLCLLVGAFNPLKFKVISDIYVPIAIFKLFGVDFVDLFFSLVFFNYISPFNICCKDGLMVQNRLNFACLKIFFNSPSILNEILAGYSNLGCGFFPFSTLNVSCHSLLACRVSPERSAVEHMGFNCMLPVASPLLLLILFLCV